MTTSLTPGPTNTLVDVSDLRVGHAQRVGDGWLTGTTVVVTPTEGAVAGVDVRGGGPGTRETDLLDPRNLVERVHAVVLSGGSAFGLAAADGVMQRLAADGRGFPVAETVVPIVPGAVLFDLGRGGDPHCRPDATFGSDAYDSAVGPAGEQAVPLGCVGAGTGAVVGGLKGGVGSASAVLSDGTTVAALVAVNAAGSAVDLSTGELFGARHGFAGEFAELQAPDPAEVDAALAAAQRTPGLPRSLATTLVVLATDATLTKAQCQKVAGIGHDGLARAISPVHTMFDGDTVFTLATGAVSAPHPMAFHELLSAAGDCVTRAVVHGVLAAESVETSAGSWRSYREVFPSAFVPGAPKPSAADTP